MGSACMKCLQLLLLLMAAAAANSSGTPILLNYPGSPSYVQANGHLIPIASSPTAFATHTVGLPVLTAQSSFFLKSFPPLAVTPAVTPALPVAPALPFAPSVPLTPTAPTNPTPVVPLPPPPRAVPTYLVYSDGAVVPLSDTHYKFPPILEGFVNRIQNYFSNYVQIDPNSAPFPIKKPKPSNTADNSSTAAITTTTTTTTTAKTFGNAINLRLIAPTNQNQPGSGVAFTRTSTVPTSSGRTAKLVEIFKPINSQPSAALVLSSAEDNGQTPLAVATATATVNFDGSDQQSPPNRPLPEFVPQGSNNVNNQIPPKDDKPPNRPSSRPPNRPSSRPPKGPDATPPKGYRYNRPLRPLEYDVPPKPQDYRSKGSF